MPPSPPTPTRHVKCIALHPRWRIQSNIQTSSKAEIIDKMFLEVSEKWAEKKNASHFFVIDMYVYCFYVWRVWSHKSTFTHLRVRMCVYSLIDLNIYSYTESYPYAHGVNHTTLFSKCLSGANTICCWRYSDPLSLALLVGYVPLHRSMHVYVHPCIVT